MIDGKKGEKERGMGRKKWCIGEKEVGRGRKKMKGRGEWSKIK